MDNTEDENNLIQEIAGAEPEKATSRASVEFKVLKTFSDLLIVQPHIWLNSA
jgi:hypothetical protein